MKVGFPAYKEWQIKKLKLRLKSTIIESSGRVTREFEIPARFPSGQRGRTVNPLAQPSQVRILLSPPTYAKATVGGAIFSKEPTLIIKKVEKKRRRLSAVAPALEG